MLSRVGENPRVPSPGLDIVTRLARSVKIMQDLPGQTLKHLLRIFLQDLERFMQESYKILQELPK